MGSPPTATNGAASGANGTNGAKTLRHEPLKRGTSIDHLEYVDVTPIIGREYPTARLKEMLDAPNAEEQLRDLAITICERGVVFFRAPQDDLSVDEQKHITDLLGKLTGRPEENGLHVHPLYNDPNNLPMEDGTTDKNMYVCCPVFRFFSSLFPWGFPFQFITVHAFTLASID